MSTLNYYLPMYVRQESCKAVEKAVEGSCQKHSRGKGKTARINFSRVAFERVCFLFGIYEHFRTWRKTCGVFTMQYYHFLPFKVQIKSHYHSYCMSVLFMHVINKSHRLILSPIHRITLLSRGGPNIHPKDVPCDSFLNPSSIFEFRWKGCCSRCI